VRNLNYLMTKERKREKEKGREKERGTECLYKAQVEQDFTNQLV